MKQRSFGLDFSQLITLTSKNLGGYYLSGFILGENKTCEQYCKLSPHRNTDAVINLIPSKVALVCPGIMIAFFGMALNFKALMCIKLIINIFLYRNDGSKSSKRWTKGWKEKIQKYKHGRSPSNLGAAPREIRKNVILSCYKRSSQSTLQYKFPEQERYLSII